MFCWKLVAVWLYKLLKGLNFFAKASGSCQFHKKGKLDTDKKRTKKRREEKKVEKKEERREEKEARQLGQSI
jgi:hypothetical protein